MSSEEEEEDIIEREEDKTLEKNFHAGPQITFAAVLRRIIQNHLPLSQQHPGYLLGFIMMLQAEDNLPTELENSLHGFQKAAQIWNNGIGKASKKGVIEYLESCKSLMGNWFAMSFDVTTLESVKTFLGAYNGMDITEEDCSRFVEKTLTSTSSTTATSATACAGATGSKRQKLMEQSLEEIDVHIEDIHVEVEPQPTFKTYCSITARKDGQQFIKKLEEPWSGYHMRVTVYRTQDLVNCPKASEQWKYKHLEMDMNFKDGSPLSKMTNQIKLHVLQYLQEKGAKWAPKKEYNFGQ